MSKKKKKPAYKTGGKKMQYNFAGQLPGALQGLMGNAAMSGQGGIQKAPWEHKIGSLMQGAGSVANIIPGAGPMVGMGLNMVGGFLQTLGAPEMTDPERINSNPMGMAMGGNMQGTTEAPAGGNFKGLSNSAMEVQAHQPGLTDSVDAGQVMLDDSEVVVGDNVFSSTLKNPHTGLSFAEQEKQTQKMLGKFEKYQTNTGDTEMKDAKYHKKNSEELFNAQETIATQLGLRNKDGSPVQNMQGAPEGMWAGGKKKFATGGNSDPGDGGPTDPIKIIQMLQETFRNSGVSETYGKDRLPYATLEESKDAQNIRSAFNSGRMPLSKSIQGLNTNYTGAYSGPQGYPVDQSIPTGPGGPLEGIKFNAGSSMPFGSQLSNRPIGTVSSSGIPQQGAIPPAFNETTTIQNGGLENTGDGGLGTIDPNDPNVDPTGTGTGAGSNMDDLLKQFQGSNPYGEKATKMGEMISGLGLAANRPFYVNYGDVGREEINQQNLSLARQGGGEQAAINDVLAQSKAAREQAGGRSFQTMQANLSNLSTNTGNALAKVRGQFAQQEVGLRSQIGARRTGIEQANLKNQMYQDDVNTREYDSLWKENLQNMTNLRNMQLERQFAFNKFRKDSELSQLLKTQDFEYGPNGELVFKKTKANYAGREGDITNNEGSTYNNGRVSSTVSPALQNLGSTINNNSTGLATGKTGAAIPNFGKQYPGSTVGFQNPYKLNFLNRRK